MEDKPPFTTDDNGARIGLEAKELRHRHIGMRGPILPAFSDSDSPQERRRIYEFTA